MKPVFFALSALLAFGTIVRAAEDSPVIAKVGGEEVSAQAIKPYLDNLDPRVRAALEKDPALLNQTVRAFILQQLLFKEAASMGWEKKPDVVQQLERLRQGAIAESYLRAVTEVPPDYPSDAQIQTAFDARKEQLILPRSFELAQIFVAAPKGSDQTALDRAFAHISAVQKSLKQSGADFADVAKRESEEPDSASRGGEVGWLTESSIQPEIRSHVTSLGKGQMTEPVQLNDGWYIVKVVDLKESRPATLAEVRPQIIQLLRDERAKANRESYLAKLQQQNPVAINELGLTVLLDRKP